MNIDLFSTYNLPILIISIIFVLISTKLYLEAAGTLWPTKINPISGSYYFLLFLSVIGTVLILFGASHSTSRYMRHYNVKLLAWSTIMILIVAFPYIIKLLNKITKTDPASYEEYRKKEVSVIATSEVEFISMVIASLVVLSAVFYTFFKLGMGSPIFALLRGEGAETLAKLRMIADVNFPGNTYIKNIFALALTPFISMIALSYALKTKQIKWILMFVVLFLASNLIVFYNLQKAPIIFYWISLILLAIYQGLNIKPVHFIILILASSLAIILMYIFISNQSLKKILSVNGPINRILFTTPTGYIHHLETFLYKMEFLYGASMPKPIGHLVFGADKVVRSSALVMQGLNFDGILNGTAGVYNGLFLGEAFANFGKVGLIIATIHVPTVFFLVTKVFTSIKKTPVSVALYSYWTITLLNTLHGGYTDYVFSMIWTIVTITGLALLLFNKIFQGFFPVKAKREDRQKDEEATEDKNPEKNILETQKIDISEIKYK